jgi:tetraprenyl-beta-curcumene synthase
LTWGLREVSRELERWRALAEQIHDPALREDALEAIDGKRANIYGAGLFSTLPDGRSRTLLKLLVAFEILADYLDCTSERGAQVGVHNGLRLHQALLDALDGRRRLCDYYEFHVAHEDSGYLLALVDACRELHGQLPSYETLAPAVTRAARLALVLALNHEPDPGERDRLLEGWAAAHRESLPGLAWFERTGAASAWLTVLALLTLAADPACSPEQARETFCVYMPWISLAGTMLDSYGDRGADAATGDHSYIAHYPNPESAIERLAEIIERSLAGARSLPNGARHAVLASCMTAMYLSKDSVRAPDAHRGTTHLLKRAGPLVRVLAPVLRAWRLLNHQRNA